MEKNEQGSMPKTIFPCYPPEFSQFFEAMSNEMLRHKEEKGDSWKEPGFMGQRVTTGWLEYLLRRCVENYEERTEPDELVDIANICAMLWLKRKGEPVPAQKEKGRT